MDEEMAAALGESVGAAAAPTTSADEYREQLGQMSEFEDFGPLFKSSRPASLTESETEYKVEYVKHMFENHCVLQFNMLNTLNDQILENVRVLVAPDELDADDCIFVPAKEMKYDQPTVAYTAFEIDASDPSAVLEIKLDFVVKDCDPDTGEVDEEGYADTYALDDVEISIADYMMPVDKPNFAAAWKELDDAPGTVEETFELPSLEDIEDAVSKITGLLGMRPCEKSDRVKAGKNTHVLYLAGVYVGGVNALVRARLAFDEHVTLKLAVRSESEELATLICATVGG